MRRTPPAPDRPIHVVGPHRRGTTRGARRRTSGCATSWRASTSLRGSRFERLIDHSGLESRNAEWPETLGVERVAALRETAPEFLARCEHDGT